MTTTSSLGELTFRPFRNADFPALLRLWDMAGWGPVSEVWFRRRWMEGPAGPASIMLAEAADGLVVGSVMDDTKAATVMGEDALVGRGHAAILAPQLRRHAQGTSEVTEDHPMVRLMDAQRESRNRDDVRLRYQLPAQVMSDFRGVRKRRGPSNRIELGSLSVQMTDAPWERPRLDVSEVRVFGTAYDRLWEQARRGMDIQCAVKRDSVWLNHLHGGGLTLECRMPLTGEIVGYASFWNGRQGGLSDMLAVDRSALVEVLRSAVIWLNNHPDTNRIETLSSMAHPMLVEAMEAIGATETDWTWRFSVSSLSEELGPEHDPANWYFTQGD